MKRTRTAFVVCGVLALASCARSEITAPESREGRSRVVPHAQDAARSQGVVADTMYSRAGGAFGMGSGG
jgi:hypothetical protein